MRRVLAPEAVGYEGRRQRVAVVRQRGKRKEQYLDLAADDNLLDSSCCKTSLLHPLDKVVIFPCRPATLDELDKALMGRFAP